jgi:hypothetical protein
MAAMARSSRRFSRRHWMASLSSLRTRIRPSLRSIQRASMPPGGICLERPRPELARLRARERPGADVARDDLDLVEDREVGEEHRERGRLLAGRARGAPDARPGPGPHQRLDEIGDDPLQGVELAEEIRLVDDEDVEEGVELGLRGVVVAEVVVVIEERVEAGLDGAGRDFIGDHVDVGEIVVEAAPLLDEGAQDREDLRA